MGKLDQQKNDFITTFALAFGKQVAMTDAHASLGDSYLRSILEANFSDSNEEYRNAGATPYRWGVLFPSGIVVKTGCLVVVKIYFIISRDSVEVTRKPHQLVP